MSCWRYTPTPKQDRFQDLLEAICPDLLHTTLSKKNNYHCYSNIPQLLSAEVVLCMHKTTILCQFGLFCHQLTTISPSILNHFWWELYQPSPTPPSPKDTIWHPIIKSGKQLQQNTSHSIGKMAKATLLTFSANIGSLQLCRPCSSLSCSGGARLPPS